MNILMVNNTCGSGWYYKKELEQRGHTVVFISSHNPICDGVADYPNNPKGWSTLKKDYSETYFDIVHINAPNVFLIKNMKNYIKFKKSVCHWRGTDIRNKANPTIIYNWHGSNIRRRLSTIGKVVLTLIYAKYFRELPDYHLYSTVDLRWCINRIFPGAKMELLRTPIDTKKFKPIIPLYTRTKDKLIWGKGGLNNDKWIPHDEVPNLLNKYIEVTCYPSQEIDPHIISVSALEAAACGCKVTHHPYMDREWVLKNASIKSQTDKLEKIYYKILGAL